MECFTCKQEITGASVNSYIENEDRTQLVSSLHPECWNTIVQYLQEARLEWDKMEEIQNTLAYVTEFRKQHDPTIQSNRRSQVSGSTAEAGRTPRYRL